MKVDLSSAVFKNKVLRSLPAESVARLDLRPVNLPVGREMERPGEPIRNVFFIESGLGSITSTFQDGSQVEVCLFGFESVLGVSALMGTKESLNRVYMQMEGHGYMSPAEAARREFGACGEFHKLALGYVQAQLTQAMQSAACNAKHNMDQRLARWLLLCADGAGTDKFDFSQEFISEMLGATRPSVSIGMARLKRLALIDYNRGKIHIVNRKGLETRVCECYSVVRNHLDNFDQFSSGAGV